MSKANGHNGYHLDTEVAFGGGASTGPWPDARRAPLTPLREPITSKPRLDVSEILRGKNILLIGTTGFVGKVALSMLLHRYPDIGRVYCLVRPGAGNTADERFFRKVATSEAFDPVHHPSYIEFFNRVLTETTDSYTLETKYQDEFAYNPSYVEMYRRGNAYHGAHPCFMWYWGQRGREKTSRVIVVGPDNATVPEIMGWETAGTVAEAIAMARSTMGRSAQITMLHHPPYMISDVM